MARLFSGSNGSYLNFGNVDTDMPNQAVEFNLWAYFHDLSTIDILFAQYGAGPTGPFSQVRTNGAGGLLYQQSFSGLGGPVKNLETDNGLLTEDAWINIAWHGNGTIFANQDHIYINGVEATYQLVDNAFGGISVPEGGPWLFGGRLDNVNNLDGRLAECFYQGHENQNTDDRAALAAGFSPLLQVRNSNFGLQFFKTPSLFYAPLWGYAPERSLIQGDVTGPATADASGVSHVKHPPINYVSHTHYGPFGVVSSLPILRTAVDCGQAFLPNPCPQGCP